VNEQEAMSRAIELAWGGWGQVHPNPMVGAVVLQDGQVVGEGFHARYGDAHAEPLALEHAGSQARGGTLVVTLEPCSHVGKQPPCVEAILSADIARVVMALNDPNPEASGGAALLRAAGLKVQGGILSPEAAYQSAAFRHRFTTPDRPFVALKLATSVDARIADHDRQSSWVSEEPAREYVHWLRAGFDAIAVGAGTARADDPRLTVRGSVSPRVPPARVVFTRSGELPANLALTAGDTGSTTYFVIVGEFGESRSDEPVTDGVVEIRARTLGEALGALRDAGINTILVEGGGELGGGLLAAGLVDRFYWIQSPLWLGDRGVPAFPGVPSPLLKDAGRWAVTERRALGRDTLMVMDSTTCLPD
jgi:diaminohydroxyphosphoribosylaminopyrimidine deaminase/5-amino-6-(5-phosphoribosylamino)uracil reductase